MLDNTPNEDLLPLSLHLPSLLFPRMETPAKTLQLWKKLFILTTVLQAFLLMHFVRLCFPASHSYCRLLN